jgi:hypothetical protein
MGKAVVYVFAIIVALVAPRALGLVDKDSGILMSGVWGGVFGACGGALGALVLMGVEKMKKSGGGGVGKSKSKLKLSKEQKAYVQDLVKLESRIQICREYLDLWMRFFRFFAEIHTEEKDVTPADEKAFFQCMTSLARKHFMFVELAGDTFDGDKEIVKILCVAVSLSNVKAMNENTLDKLELDWHNLFLSMNKSLGRMLRMLPGEDRTLTELLANLRATKPAAAPAK